MASEQDVRSALALQTLPWSVFAGDPRGYVREWDRLAKAGAGLSLDDDRRKMAMDALSKQTVDQFDVLSKEAALAGLRLKQKSSRAASFVTGPRGIEGPLANLILGGGTSMLGR